MRYIPIYLRQGLVILSLMSMTFLLLWLPLFGSSWRIGQGQTCDLTPHLLGCLCGSCGHRILIRRRRFGFFLCAWPGFDVDHWALFLLGLEREFFFFPIDVEADFSNSHIVVCSNSAQEWPPKDEQCLFWYFHVEHYEVYWDEVRTWTGTSSAIPSE